MDKNIHGENGGNGHASDDGERFVLADKLNQGFSGHLFDGLFVVGFTGTVPTMVAVAMGRAHLFLILAFSSLEIIDLTATSGGKRRARRTIYNENCTTKAGKYMYVHLFGRAAIKGWHLA